MLEKNSQKRRKKPEKAKVNKDQLAASYVTLANKENEILNLKHLNGDMQKRLSLLKEEHE